MRYLTLTLLGVAGSAHAHMAAIDDYSSGETWVAALLATAGLAYGAGVYRLWRSAAIGRGISITEALAFAVAWTTSIVALAEPAVALAGTSFAAHMTQHEALMLLAAPLFVIGRPLAAWSWTFPEPWPQRIAGAAPVRVAALVWRALTQPLVATLFQLAVVWVAHAPRVFDWALQHPWAHAGQHIGLFVAAIAFWTAMLRRSKSAEGLANAALTFVTMLGIGALGALLTFSRMPWYAPYALDDQRLGGLIMWIPGGLPYIAVALWLLMGSLRLWHSRKPRMAAEG